MRTVNVSETRENLAQLLDAVEAGEQIVIVRRDRPVARLVPVDASMTAFLDRTTLRAELPAMKEPVEAAVRSLRDEERY